MWKKLVILLKTHSDGSLNKGTSIQAAKRTFIFLGLISIAAFTLRILPLVNNWDHPAFFMQYDSRGYYQLAKNLQDGHGYSWKDKEPYEPNIYRPPGMPVILLGLFSVFGPSIPWAILLQVILSSGVVVMTYLVTWNILGERIALIAAAFQALDPLSIIYSNLLLTEVYSSIIIISAAYLAERYLIAGKRKLLIIIGILIGLGIMIHPILLFLPIFIAILPLFSKTKLLHLFAVAGIGTVIGIVPATCWIVRNIKVADYTGISCVAAVNLMKYKAAGVLSDINGTTLIDEANNLSEECEIALPRNPTRGARWKAWQRKAVSILLAHPVVYIKLHLKGMFREFFGPCRDNLTRIVYGSKRVLSDKGVVTDESIKSAVSNNFVFRLDLVRYMALSFQALIYLLFFVGLAILLITNRFKLALGLSFPIGYILFLSGGPEAFCRFRAIYMPFVNIFAALGFENCLRFCIKDLNI